MTIPFADRPGAAKFAALAVLALTYVAVLWANLPGHMTYDSVVQLADGRAGTYHLWHPPVMAWLLGIGDRIHPGQAPFVIANAALYFGTLMAMVWMRPRVGWWAVAVAVLMALSPLVLIYQAIVWKDVLFANAAVAGFVWLSISAEVQGWKRIAAVVWAFLLLGVAALTRQNGAIVVPIGAAALSVTIVRRDGRAAWKRAAGLGLAALLLSFALVEGAESWFVAHRADQAGSREEIRIIQLFDIVGALTHDPTIDLSPFGANAANIRAATADYTPTRVDTLVDDDGIDVALKSPDQTPKVWRDLVLHHTRAYLAQRADAFWWTFSPPKVEACLAVAVGVDGPPEVLKALHMATRYTLRDRRMASYARGFFHTPVYSHLPYAVLALVLAILLLRSKAPDDAPILFLLAAVFLFTASFVLISLACDFRYLYALDLAAMTTALRFACGLGRPPYSQAPPATAH